MEETKKTQYAISFLSFSSFKSFYQNPNTYRNRARLVNDFLTWEGNGVSSTLQVVRARAYVSRQALIQIMGQKDGVGGFL